MLLEDKNAVIYGAGGSIGGAVARAFAREGARVFLVGRTREKLEVVGRDIAAAGGFAEVAEVNALDEAAYKGLLESLDQMRMTRRSPRLDEVAATATFLASDKAGAITGTFVNVTSGMFPS